MVTRLNLSGALVDQPAQERVCVILIDVGSNPLEADHLEFLRIQVVLDVCFHSIELRAGLLVVRIEAAIAFFGSERTQRVVSEAPA
jgi:hypothetical protein